MPSTVRRLLTGTALVGGAVLLGRGLARRKALIAPVADELRSPILYLPMHLRSDRVLNAVRSVSTKATTPIVPGVVVSDRSVPAGDHGPAVRVVVYEQPGRTRPSGALLWIHGGGMVMGRPEQAHAWCSAIAAELGVLVVSVDYRLAPEHPFPAPLEDCYAALAWLHDQADELGVDPARVAVGGDSAGGGLSAALCQVARDRGGPAVCFQLLNYPMLDDRTVLRRDHQGRGHFVWTPTSNRFGWGAYLGHPIGPVEDRQHAVPARTEDLTGLPPAWIGVGDLDLFYEEDVEYARRLGEAGVAVDLQVEPGMYHGADQIGLSAPSMDAYRTRMVEALRAALT